MTSWADEELNLLCNPENHRIYFDGYDYIWERKFGKKWGRHSILEFKDYATPYSYLCYWLAVWNHELMTRRRRRMQKERTAQRKINRLIAKYNRTEAERNEELKDIIVKMQRLSPKMTHEQIAHKLGISRYKVTRILQ